MIYTLIKGCDAAKPDEDSISLRFAGGHNKVPTFNGVSLKDTWNIPSFVFVNEDGALYNFISMSAADTFLCDEKGKEFLVSLLFDKIEFLPLVYIREVFYYVVNIVNVIDALDMDKSRIVYFPEPNHHMVRKIDPFVFSLKKTKGQLLFKESFRPVSGIYCTDEFRILYEKSGLIGLDFANIGGFTISE